MQRELEHAGTRLEIHLLGVNAATEESGNAGMTQGRMIPWLQDTSSQKVWSRWGVTFRDVVILDGENRRAGVFNLTQHDLHEQANYDSLKTMLLDAAR